MEGIRSNVAVTTQQPKKSNKVSKHLINTGVTTAGLGMTGYAYKKTGDIWRLAQTPDSLCGVGKASKMKIFARKIKNGFEKLGEMIFKNHKIHRMFERYEMNQGLSGSELARAVKFNKGCAAKVLTLATVALSILAAGIYKAGKINGEG